MSVRAPVPPGTTVLDADQVRRTLTRIGHEIVERTSSLEDLYLVGIYSRGVPLAERLRELIGSSTGVGVPVGALDIAFYRDDVAARGGDVPLHPQPVVNATRLEEDVDGRTVILVDDVLYTGRTIRAAIEAVFDWGRPARVQLAVLADRGHRELPIRADYVGKNLPTARGERVAVRLEETDGGPDEVLLIGSEAGR
jgi:pyrimidine operon attenuation protein/uracil phosphoribosyltransferase